MPERRRRIRARGCLLWILGLIVLLVILSLLFGGFRKGSKVGEGAPAPVGASAPALLRVAAPVLLSAATGRKRRSRPARRRSHWPSWWPGRPAPGQRRA